MQLSLLDWQPEPVPTAAATTHPAPTTSSRVLQVWRCTHGKWHYTGQMGFEHALTLRPGDRALPFGAVPELVASTTEAAVAPLESAVQPSQYRRTVFKMHFQKEMCGVSVAGLLHCPSLLFWLAELAAIALAECPQCQWFVSYQETRNAYRNGAKS